MKKLFEEPAMDVQKFDVEDVITTSNGGGNGNLDENEGDLDIGG